MRLVVCVATLAVIGLSSVASAGDKTVTAVPASSQSNAPVAQVSQSNVVTFQPVRRSSTNFFGRVMELERRKNAWLRRTFLQ